jgi:hypothetical protein
MPVALLTALSITLHPARAEEGDWEPEDVRMLWISSLRDPISGVENAALAADVLGRLEDRLLPGRLFREEAGLYRLASGMYRVLKLAMLDVPAAAWLTVFQHEYYGHGFRAREAGFDDIRYELELPPPYGSGEGSTSWIQRRPASADEFMAMAMAGIEATDLLARGLRGHWIAEGRMDYHDAFLYLFSSSGLGAYLEATSEDETDRSNDIVAYLVGANGKAGLNYPREAWLRQEDLEDGSRWNFADPFYWFSWWTLLRYAWNGRTHWRYPAVPLGPVRWLPAAGYRLTPFGGEYVLENLLAAEGDPGIRRTLALRGAYGRGELGRTWAAGLQASGIPVWKGVALDAGLDAWRQPPLRLDPFDGRAGRGGRWGCGAEVGISMPTPFRFLRFAVAAGYKGEGYLPGYRLREGATFRAGLGPVWGG